MMLRSHCIRDRQCDDCDFRSECIVQRVMYSQMEIQPAFMTSGDSVGYVLECEDYREHFKEGDDLSFNLILFGKTIVYFSQFIDAFYRLGMSGIGKNRSRFTIKSITNTKKKPILSGNDVLMNAYTVGRLEEYIDWRVKKADISKGHIIKFKTPLSLKCKGEKLYEFNAEAIIKAIARRVYMMDCFEGIEASTGDIELDKEIQILSETHRNVGVPRYSSRQESKMTLWGIEGEISIDKVSEETLKLLYAGELLHIGKNTSFGFGRYRVI